MEPYESFLVPSLQVVHSIRYELLSMYDIAAVAMKKDTMVITIFRSHHFVLVLISKKVIIEQNKLKDNKKYMFGNR